MTGAGIGGRDNPPVRSDIIYFATRNDGAVFSASPMAWCGSLSHNNVGQMTENVLQRFSAAGAIEEVSED